MKIFDVTLPIIEGLQVYPGDPPIRIRRVSDAGEGGVFTLSEICMSSHVGTHVDAPLHFFPEGKPVDELPLEVLIGDALVVEVDGVEVTADALARADISQDAIRLLLKTQGAFLSESAARWIIDNGVRLVGIDSISVDAEGSDKLAAHRILLEAGIVIVEGLALDEARPGMYEMVCLPLKVKGCDGAPARVVLVEGLRLG